jgi:hypothetical protein
MKREGKAILRLVVDEILEYANVPGSPEIEVPEKWANIKCVIKFLCVDGDVLDILTILQKKDDLKVVEKDCRKCFELYQLQVGKGKDAISQKDSKHETTYELVFVNDDERVSCSTDDDESPYIMLYHGLFD